MKTAKSTKTFNAFLRNNRSKLSNSYPFLSQSQIFSKLKEQWKKLNNPMPKSSMKKEFSNGNSQHALPQLSNSQKNLFKSDRITLSRQAQLAFQQNNMRQSLGTCVYDFVDSGYESPVFCDDEVEVDSPYLFAKDAMDTLNNWGRPMVHWKDVKNTGSAQAYYVPENIESLNRHMGSYQTSSFNNYNSDKTRGIVKSQRKKAIQKDPKAKVWFHNHKNIFKFEDEIDTFDFDEETLHIEEHRKEGFQSAVTNQNWPEKHQPSKSKKKMADQRLKEQHSRGVGETKSQSKDQKFQQRRLNRQKDGTPESISKRLYRNPLKERSQTDNCIKPRNKIELTKFWEKRTHSAEISNKTEQTYAQQSTCKSKFQLKAQNGRQMKSHKEHTMRGHSFNKQTGAVKKLPPTLSERRKIIQRNNTAGKSKTAKGNKGKGILDSNERFLTESTRKNLELIQTYGCSPSLVDRDSFSTYGERSFEHSIVSCENDSEDVAIITSGDQCICSDNEDAVLISRQDFFAYDTEGHEQGILISPLQNKSVNEQNATCATEKFPKYQNKSPVTLVAFASSGGQWEMSNTKSNPAAGKRCLTSDNPFINKKFCSELKNIEFSPQNIITGRERCELSNEKSKYIWSPNDSEDADITGSVDHCICSDDEDAFLIARQRQPSHGNSFKEQSRSTNMSSSQNTSVDAQKPISSNPELTETHEKLQLDLVMDPPEEKEMSSDPRTSNTVNKKCVDPDNKYIKRKFSSALKKMTSSPLNVNNNQERSLCDVKKVSENTQSLENVRLRRTTSKFVSKWNFKSRDDCWNTSDDYNKDDQDESWDTDSIVSEKSDKLCVGEFSIFEEENQVITKTDSVLKHDFIKTKAPESSENTANADDMQSTSRTSSQKSGSIDSDNSIFKKPLGIMFQDPVSETPVSVNTPGKRRLVSSAMAATSSNFGSMFDALDIFM